MRKTALLLLLCGLPAAASTGGDEHLSPPCLERGGKRVLFTHGDDSESGNADGVFALDVATGKFTELIGEAPPDEQPDSAPLFKGCKPLKPVRLSDAGLTASSKTPEEDKAPQKYDPKDYPDDADLFRPMHRQILTVSAQDKPVLSLPYSICYDATDPAQLTAWVMPGKPFVVVSFLFHGQCCCGGSISATVELLPDVLTLTGKTPKPRDEQSAQTAVPIEPPTVPYERMTNDIGMALYRAGRLEDAATYFEAAYESGKGAKPPYLLPLYNRAASLAKLGKKKEALDALAILFSFAKERARFREKVKKDKDFDALRTEADFQQLLTSEDCCVHFVSDSSVESSGSRSRTEWWWREGESVVHLDEQWSWGKKIHEQLEDGSYKTWYESGVLSGEGVLRGRSGWGKRYHEDGTLYLDEKWVDGVRVPADAGTQ